MTDRRGELLFLMKVKIPDRPGVDRQIWPVHRKPGFWSVSYSGSLPRFELFDDETVKSLITTGRLKPAHHDARIFVLGGDRP